MISPQKERSKRRGYAKKVGKKKGTDAMTFHVVVGELPPLNVYLKLHPVYGGRAHSHDESTPKRLVFCVQSA